MSKNVAYRLSDEAYAKIKARVEQIKREHPALEESAAVKRAIRELLAEAKKEAS